MSPTRPPNNRTMSSCSQAKVLESPTLSATNSSAPSSIDGDDEPSQAHSRSSPVAAEEVMAKRDSRDIVERGRTPTVEPEQYDAEDARSMSPRRNSEELERIGSEAKAMLEQQARTLQSGLLALLDRVDKVREQHDKLEGENRFLQEYIGSLMATSKITGNSNSGRGRNSSNRLK